MTIFGYLKTVAALGGRVYNHYPASVPPGLFAVVEDGDETSARGTYEGDRTQALVTVSLFQPGTDGQLPPRASLITAWNQVWDEAPAEVDTDGTSGQAARLDRVTAVRPTADEEARGNYAACRFRLNLSRP